MPKKTTIRTVAEHDQLEVSVRKSRQKAELLIIQPKFREDVAKLRDKWNIPLNGFSSVEDYDKWQRSFGEQNWNYQKIEYRKFRQQHRSESNYAVKLKYFSDKSPNNLFQQDLAGLVKKHKLSPFWVQGLRGYLLRNAIPLPAGVVIEKSFDPITKLPVLKLVLQEDTSIKDITSIWEQVKKYQEQLPYWRQQKSQPILNLERNKKAYELKESGKSYNDIANELYCGYSEAMDYVKSYKSYLKKNRIK
jgi:hypothetical protein